jgi:hypothetical protein
MILLKIISVKPVLYLPDKNEFMFHFKSNAKIDTKGRWVYD